MEKKEVSQSGIEAKPEIKVATTHVSGCKYEP